MAENEKIVNVKVQADTKEANDQVGKLKDLLEEIVKIAPKISGVAGVNKSIINSYKRSTLNTEKALKDLTASGHDFNSTLQRSARTFTTLSNRGNSVISDFNTSFRSFMNSVQSMSNRMKTLGARADTVRKSMKVSGGGSGGVVVQRDVDEEKYAAAWSRKRQEETRKQIIAERRKTRQEGIARNLEKQADIRNQYNDSFRGWAALNVVSQQAVKAEQEQQAADSIKQFEKEMALHYERYGKPSQNKQSGEQEQSQEQQQKGPSRLGNFFSGIGNRMTTYFTYSAIDSVVQGFKATVGAAVDLEAEFANIQAITSATDSTMASLKDTILSVGENSKYTTEEIAAATVELGQAGLSAEEIDNVLETTTQLAAATGSSLSNTVDLMTSTLAVWGLNSTQAEHLSDVMVTGMNKTKATLETFRMAVQYAGATMASLNGSFEELAAVASAASNAGLRASVIGTGMRGVIAELISPTAKMKKGLAQLGLTTDDVNVRTKGLVNVLQTLKDAGMNAGNAYDMFGRRAATFALAAQGQLDVVNDLQLAFAESGATQKAYSIQMNTTKAQFTALANTIKEAAYDILDSTDGMIHNTVAKISRFLQWAMDDVSDEYKDVMKQNSRQLSSVDNYQSILFGLQNKDYAGRLSEAIRDFNSLAESIKKAYGIEIELVKTAEDLPKAYREASEALAQQQLTSARKSNEEREKVIDSRFMELEQGTLANLFTPNSYFRTHTEALQNVPFEKVNPLTVSPDLYVPNGGIQQQVIRAKDGTLLPQAAREAAYNERSRDFYLTRRNIMRNYVDRMSEEGLENGFANISSEIDTSNLKDSAKEALTKLLNEAADIIKKAGDEIDISKLNENDLSRNLNQAFNFLLSDVEDNLDFDEYLKKNKIDYHNMDESVLETWFNTLHSKITGLSEKYITEIKEGDNVIGYEIPEDKKQALITDLGKLQETSTESSKKSIQLVIDYLNTQEGSITLPPAIKASLDELLADDKEKLQDSAKRAYESFLNFWDKMINSLQGIPEFLRNLYSKNTEKAKMAMVNINDDMSPRDKETALQKVRNEIQSDKDRAQSRRDSAAYRARQEAKRNAEDAARRRVQSFSDKFAPQDNLIRTFEQEQKGYAARVSQVEPSGGYYTGEMQSLSSQADELKEKLEGLKAQDMLASYQKEFGDLTEKVNSEKVNLADLTSEEQSAYNKMSELQAIVAYTKAKYGELNATSFDELLEKLDTVSQKEKEVAENADTDTSSFSNWMNNFKSGFSSGVNDMQSQYNANSIGKMLSQDISNGMSDAVISVAEGNKSIKDSFSDMAESVVRSLAQMLIRGGINTMMSSFTGGIQTSGSGAGASSSGGSSFFSNLFGGGKASGGPVRGGTAGRDSVPTKLMPGEYVLKKSAVDSLGTNFLNDLNNNASQTLAGTASSLWDARSDEDSSDSASGSVVNVWVVSEKDEAQMGPNDVIATISKDILTGGQTKRLIQSVVAGRK